MNIGSIIFVSRNLVLYCNCTRKKDIYEGAFDFKFTTFFCPRAALRGELNRAVGDVVIVNTGPTDKILHIGLRVSQHNQYCGGGGGARLFPRNGTGLTGIASSSF